MPHAVTISNEMHACAEVCHECHDACLELVPHCLSLGGEHAEPGHIGLLLDCAQICRTSEDFMHRGSRHHEVVCAACADICDRCAEDCERFENDHEMTQCAATCRRCAESCREMAGSR